MNTQYKYLHFVAYKMLGMWDVKRYGFEGRTFPNAVRLRDLLRPFDKSISTEVLLKNNWAIISKINFSGDLFLRDVDDAKTFKGKLHIVDGDTLIYSKINVRHGCIYYHANSKLPFAVSSEYPAYKLDTTRIIGSYLVRILQSSYFKKALGVKATGISKARVKPDEFLDIQIPLPSLAEQQALVDAYNHNLQQATELEQKAENGEKEIDTRIREHLQFSISMPCCKKGLNIVRYKETSRWDPSFFFSKKQIKSSYPLVFVEQCVLNFMTDALGKSLRRETSKTPAKEYTYIGMENVEKNKGTLTNPPLVKGNTIKSQTIAVPNGYMIYGKLRPYLNKYWLNATNTPNIVCSSEFFVFDIKQ